MRKLTIFSVVLTLFLLSPASITWAQSVSISGNVYEKNTVKNSFKTPQGIITTILPDDMSAGDFISGTVLYDPEGSNQKKKSNNLEQLVKYTLFLDDATPLRAQYDQGDVPALMTQTGRLFFKVPLKSDQSSLQLLLKDVKGNTVSKAEMPLILSSQTISGQGMGDPVPTESISFTYEKIKTGYKVQKKVITTGENLVLQTHEHALDVTGPHVYMDVKGGAALDVAAEHLWLSINDREVTPVCSSQGQTIIGLPPGTIGKTSVTVKDKNGKTVFTDEFYVVDIKASIDKTNLRKNERTTMHVSADGINECPYPVSMVIVNNSSETVLLDKGVHQTYQHDPFESMKDGFISPLNIQQGVTGVVPGSYNITANLILPTTAYGDIFLQQKSALKTPEDYNAWVNAVKKDLKAYADKQGNDEVGKAAKANAQRAIDNIPTCDDKNKLEECKAFADAYLRPVNIPKGAATMWVCGFEAYKAAIKSITGTLGGKPDVIDWEVIKNGLEFVRNMGEQLNDEGLQNGANAAKKMVETIQKAGETKEKLQELNDKLNELNNKVKKEISTVPSGPYVYKMQDLQIATFINDVAGSRTMNGTNAELNVNGQSAAGVLSINRSVNGTFEMQIAPGLSAELSNWVNSFLNNNPVSTDLSVIIPTGDSRMDFHSAFISEIEFPKMDAKGKDPMFLTLTIQPEKIGYSTGNEKKKATTTKTKQWLPANFEFKLGDLPNSFINKIELPGLKAKIAKESIGQANDYRLIPGKLEYPNIKFYVPGMNIGPWIDWYNNFNISDETKTGSINYMNEKGESLFSIPLNDVKPVQINPAGDGNYQVTLKPESPDQNRPDPVNDLIGFLDPKMMVLMAVPEYKQIVLNRCHAILLANGQYQVRALTAYRQPVNLVVSLQLMPQLNISRFSKKELDELERHIDSLNRVAQADKTMGTFKHTTIDKDKATWSRFFKNALCTEVSPELTGLCEKNLNFIDPATKKEIVPFKQIYGRRYTAADKQCKKGNDDCVEYYTLWRRRTQYEDNNCTKEINKYEYFKFMCE